MVRAVTRPLLPFRRAGLEALSDEALVANCADDNGALEELFRRHGDRVHRVLARLSHVERHDLEDLVQATFVVVKRSTARFDARSAVATWIVGIALNELGRMGFESVACVAQTNWLLWTLKRRVG